MDKETILRLRQEFRTIPFDRFKHVVEIYRILGGSVDELVADLREEEARALENQKHEAEKVAHLLGQIKLSEMHHQIDLPELPPNIDREHVQAIIAYGFVMPGRSSIYAGGNKVPLRYVQVNVRNKLQNRFDQDKYRLAVGLLEQNGLIAFRRGKGQTAVSLNIHAKEKQVTALGCKILTVIKQFIS